MRNSFSSTGGRVVVGGSSGFVVDGALKVIVVLGASPVDEDGAVVGEGAAENDPEPVPVLLGPQLTSTIARRTVAPMTMTLRTGTSGGVRQYQTESVGLRAANRNPRGSWT